MGDRVEDSAGDTVGEMVADSVVDEDDDKKAEMLTVAVSRDVGMPESVIVDDPERLTVGDGECEVDALPVEEKVAAPLRERVSVADIVELFEPETVNEIAELTVAVELTLSTEAVADTVLESMGELLGDILTNGEEVDEPDAHTVLESNPDDDADDDACEEAVESGVHDSEKVIVAILEEDTVAVNSKLDDTDPVGDLGSIDMLMVAVPETVGVQLENSEAEPELDAACDAEMEGLREVLSD